MAIISAVNFKIAKTHLLAKKRQTLIAMLGVTFGIAMFILMISFMSGFNEFLEDTMLSSTPDIRMYNDINTDYSKSIVAQSLNDTTHLAMVSHQRPKDVQAKIKTAYTIATDLSKDPRVIAVSPQLTTQVFYNNGPVQLNGSLQGVNIDQESKLVNLAGKMKTGHSADLMTTSNGILLGQGLANKLNAKLGDMVMLASPQGNVMRFRVVGTFQFGIGTLDNVRSYVNLSSVQQLMGKDNTYITDLNIKLKDKNIAPKFSVELENRYKYTAEDWGTANASATVSIMIRNVMTFVVSLTLLIVAGFGIYNIMSMTIQNKLKDIAILKAQGFSGPDIRQIFIIESVTIGVMGAISGLIFGFFLSLGIYHLPFPKNEFLNITHFPVTFHTRHYVFGLVFGTLTTLIAGLVPSMKAAKVDPVVILRG
jgi:lipoprotein-releasing system permease protein